MSESRSVAGIAILLDRAGVVVAPARVHQQVGLEHGLGELLQEQRHSIGLVHDPCHQIRWHGLVLGDAQHDAGALCSAQARKRDRRHVRALDPGRLKLGPVGDQRQQREPLDAVDQGAQDLDRARIGPVSVLEQHHACLALGDQRDNGHQQRDGLVLLPLRAHLERAVAPSPGIDSSVGRSE